MEFAITLSVGAFTLRVNHPDHPNGLWFPLGAVREDGTRRGIVARWYKGKVEWHAKGWLEVVPDPDAEPKVTAVGRFIDWLEGEEVE